MSEVPLYHGTAGTAHAGPHLVRNTEVRARIASYERGTIRNTPLLGPYSRTLFRDLLWSWGREGFL